MIVSADSLLEEILFLFWRAQPTLRKHNYGWAREVSIRIFRGLKLHSVDIGLPTPARASTQYDPAMQGSACFRGQEVSVNIIDRNFEFEVWNIIIVCKCL